MTNERCVACGGESAPDKMDLTESGYRCWSCAKAATVRDDHVELEIGAFMGPAIKQARMWLLALGAFYLVAGGVDYYRLSEARDARRDSFARYAGAESGERLAATERAFSMALWLVGFSSFVGFANMGLSLLAKKRTMTAFWAALGLFGAHTIVLFFLLGPLVLFSEVRIIFLFMLIMGFRAARKAERLRAESQFT